MDICTKNIKRRDFLKVTTGMAGAAMFPGGYVWANNQTGPKLSQLKKKTGYQPMVSSAWIPMGEHLQGYELFKKTIEAVTDFSWLSKGDRVFLKLSLNSGRPFPATTDPWLLSCMIKMLKEKGAGPIYVGDQSGIEHVYYSKTQKRGSSRHCCDTAGLLKVIEESNAIPHFFEEQGYDAYFETKPAGYHNWNTPIMIAGIVNNVDHIIYLPRVASHALGDVTSGMKIGVGFLRDDSRVVFHRGGDHFYAMYEEINHIPEIASKLRFSVSSGRSVLSLIGPDMGPISTPKHGLIFASNDLLTHEALAYAWLQYNREYETSSFRHATNGRVTKWRSALNKMLLWRYVDDSDGESTPSIPMFQPGTQSIFAHPSVINYMQHKGGKPETIHWETMNKIKNDQMTQFINSQLNI